MPSILFWNNQAVRRSSSYQSIDKFSSLFSSFNNKTKTPSHRQQQGKAFNNNNIPSLLEQPDHIKIHCDYTLYQTVLSRQNDDELLWCLAKRLKQQEDRDVVVDGEHTQAMCYRRAIRILIYYFRAHHHHPKYFKKCTNVPEPCCCPLDVRETIIDMQNAATIKYASTMITPPSQQQHVNRLTNRSMSVSSYSTTSSYNSTASNCSHCGVEKRAMPVCARCKSQAYCSNKCRMAHQPIHQQECNNSQ